MIVNYYFRKKHAYKAKPCREINSSSYAIARGCMILNFEVTYKYMYINKIDYWWVVIQFNQLCLIAGMEKTSCSRRVFLDKYIKPDDYLIFDGIIGSLHKDFYMKDNVVKKKETRKFPLLEVWLGLLNFDISSSLISYTLIFQILSTNVKVSWKSYPIFLLCILTSIYLKSLDIS